jgi:predicted negative regulator of RcsB-dependent stress response
VEVYQSEQEQVEEIKKWWAEYGNTIVTGLLLGIAILVGFRYWQHHKSEQAGQASAIYSQMLTSLRTGQNDQVSGKALQLIEEYQATPYASLAALIQARLYAESDQIDKAIGQLDWVIKNTRQNGIANVARLRLARLQLARGDANAALSTLEQDTSVSFSPAHEALKGDIFVKLDDRDKAREAYEKAIASTEIGNEMRLLLQMKIDDL